MSDLTDFLLARIAEDEVDRERRRSTILLLDKQGDEVGLRSLAQLHADHPEYDEGWGR